MNDNPPDKASSQRRRERGIFERPPKSGIWWVRYVDEFGRLHREKVGPKGLAVRVYQKRKSQIRERRFFPEQIRQRDVLVVDAIADYLNKREATLRHFYHYRRYGRYWSAALQSKTLRQVLPDDIERYVAVRIREAAPATVNRELAFLKCLFNDAIANRKVESNPVRAVRLLRENNQRVRFLTDEEEQRLQAALSAGDWPPVAVALHTGLRQSEQFNLKWENIDFDTGIVTVTRSKHGELRHIPMNDQVRQILRTLPSRQTSEWVFPSRTGRTPIDVHNFLSRKFMPAVRRSHIENLHWHDLRHTFASRLVMAGVDLRTVQELMGHKTITMTIRYSHLSARHQYEAVQRLLDRKPTGTSTDTNRVSGSDTGATSLKVVDFSG
jgi:integrase